MKDYYKTLELKFGAKDEEIKKAYRVLAQKYHPDKHFGNKKYDDFFKEINEAYSTLSDSLKKSSYDIRYRDYFFQQSSSTNTDNTNSSSGSNSNSNTKKEESTENAKTNNQQANSMNKENFTDKTKFYNNNFFRVAFLLLIVGIGFLIYKWKDISSYYDEKDRKEKYAQLISSIQETKKYKETAMSALKIPRVTLETRWKDDLMYYKFYLISKRNEDDKYSSLLNDSLKNDLYFETRVKTIEKITINFLDKDGFKVYTLIIPISDMTRIVDSNGNATAYMINSNIQLLPTLYKDLADWELVYSSN